jgi:hypothetical protein
MNTKITFAVLGLAAVLALAVATNLSSNAYAVNDKFTTDCEGPGASGGEGDCAGQSERSGPHDETLTNPSGKNQPPGLQEDDD